MRSTQMENDLINQIRDIDAEIRGLQIKRDLLTKLLEAQDANQND